MINMFPSKYLAFIHTKREIMRQRKSRNIKTTNPCAKKSSEAAERKERSQIPGSHERIKHQ